jgi:hypothetical protein
MCYSVYLEFPNTQVYSIRRKLHDVMHFIFYMATGFPDRRLESDATYNLTKSYFLPCSAPPRARGGLIGPLP